MCQVPVTVKHPTVEVFSVTQLGLIRTALMLPSCTKRHEGGAQAVYQNFITFLRMCKQHMVAKTKITSQQPEPKPTIKLCISLVTSALFIMI